MHHTRNSPCGHGSTASTTHRQEGGRGDVLRGHRLRDDNAGPGLRLQVALEHRLLLLQPQLLLVQPLLALLELKLLLHEALLLQHTGDAPPG